MRRLRPRSEPALHAKAAVKHAIGSLIIALVLFAFVWLQSRRRAPGV